MLARVLKELGIETRKVMRTGPSLSSDRLSRQRSPVKDAAEYIGRTEQALQHLIHKREIVVVRKGRHVHLDRSDLDRWIEANKV